MSLTLITNVEVYAPEHLGKCDVLLGGGEIVSIADSLNCDSLDLQRIDGKNKILLPGLVDCLAHISGGGGEGGYHTRTPEMPASEAIKAGVTSLVAALGTDAITRSLEDMLAKVKALKHIGLSVYAYTGNYHIPVTTITCDVTKDIVLIEEFIGVGEVAIADHRSSQPSTQQLAQVAAAARVGGMLSGKAGVVLVHVGPGKSRLKLLHDVVNHSDIPSYQFHPTHINRDQDLLDAGIEWAKVGGSIDMTTSTNQHFIDEGEIPAAQAVIKAIEAGVAINKISLSSDANASLPVFDSHGKLVGLEVGRMQSLYDCFKELVIKHQLPIETAIQVVSTSPADILQLKAGRIKEGEAADVLLIDKSSLTLEHVFAKGKHLLAEGELNVDLPFE